MRRDLSLSQQVVQACHACIETARHLLPPDAVHPHLVILRVRSQSDLESVAARLDSYGIRFRKFREPDFEGEATAISTEPVSGSHRAIFKRYRCWEGDSGRFPDEAASNQTSHNKTINNEGRNMPSKSQNHQSRFGFHPCDYELYSKLKFLHKHYWITVPKFHKWHRWFRKEPQNRDGPEPKYCEEFVENCRWAKPVKAGFKIYPKKLSDRGVIEKYIKARTPSPEPVEAFTPEVIKEIESLFEAVKKRERRKMRTEN